MARPYFCLLYLICSFFLLYFFSPNFTFYSFSPPPPSSGSFFLSFLKHSSCLFLSSSHYSFSHPYKETRIYFVGPAHISISTSRIFLGRGIQRIRECSKPFRVCKLLHWVQVLPGEQFMRLLVVT